jgi:hypothetical protein
MVVKLKDMDIRGIYITVTYSPYDLILWYTEDHEVIFVCKTWIIGYRLNVHTLGSLRQAAY